MSSEQRAELSELLVDNAHRRHVALVSTSPPAPDPGSLGQFIAGIRKQRSDLPEQLLGEDARRDAGSVAALALARIAANAAKRLDAPDR